MANFCSKCGSALSPDTRFCPNCGTPVSEKEPSKAPAEPRFCGSGEVREGIPAPGFSDRVNHPEILAAMKKNKKAAGIFALVLAPLPLIGFLIYGATSDGKMSMGQAFLFGLILSGIFLAFGLSGMLRSRASNTYEATVIGKQTREVYEHRNSEENSRVVTEYVTVVRKSDGSQKKILEREGSQIWAYRYLDVGDRFKYHPQFNFPYEKYDKSKAPYLACVSCGTKNSVEADRCSKCHIPLLK